VDKILIFAVVKQWLPQQRETEASFVYIIDTDTAHCAAMWIARFAEKCNNNDTLATLL